MERSRCSSRLSSSLLATPRSCCATVPWAAGGLFSAALHNTVRCICQLAGRWHIPRQLRHCIAHCRYGSDFAHSTLLLQLCRGSRQVDYFRSLQHDGGGLAAAGLLLRSYTAGTHCIWLWSSSCARGECASVRTQTSYTCFIAVLFSRWQQFCRDVLF